MRVLMINTFHHPRGGDATYTRTVSAALRAAGHDVIPLAMRHPDNTPSTWEHRFLSWIDLRGSRGLRARLRVGRRMFWSREASALCSRLVEEIRPDVAHLQHVHRHVTPSVLGPLRAAGVPIVWTVHDYELICPEGHLFQGGHPCERCHGHRYWEAIRGRCKWDSLGPSVAVALEKSLHAALGVWSRVDRFLCPSQFLADTLVRFGLPAARVTHLPNCVQVSGPPSTIAGEGCLYAGRLSTEKGVDVAIEAARRIPGQPLYICGTGPEEAAIRARAVGLPNVRFLGHLPPRGLAEVLRSVRAVVVPSRWWENFPYAVLEAQAAGRAVVASHIGGIPEQITHDHDGLLVPPNDPAALAAALRRLYAEPELAQRLGAAGAQRVRERLSVGRHLQRLLGVYATPSSAARRGPAQPAGAPPR